jgi:hypothetical protein
MRAGHIVLLGLPVWLGIAVIVFAVIFLPYNFSLSQPWKDRLNSNAAHAIVIAYFAAGSPLLGAIPILRSRKLTATRKALAIGGYVLGAFFVLWLCLIIAMLSRVVI